MPLINCSLRIPRAKQQDSMIDDFHACLSPGVPIYTVIHEIRQLIKDVQLNDLKIKHKFNDELTPT